ncbi:hypothetical protein [Novosphingobium sp. CECT 9465]|uniref:hypothetical protein n=1 Tax=Novosphingobium sp. CECT 9465 TaxID=2829794 RepID=UPI001E64C8AE|nr:hypothetical protein [Novosphingobium sp. CECT 9465]CAH0496981.1 hypothetical protein NVSP9465_02031 [Novosphingobium sp. CECT 9465]
MNDRDDLATRAKDEISGMAKQGLAHPSTKPVLTGMAIGAVAGAVLPVVSLPLGLAVGAGIAFWKRINR